MAAGKGTAISAALIWASPACAGAAALREPLVFFGIPVDFLLFAATLLGVAVFHHHTLRVALTGLAVIVAYQFCLRRFPPDPESTVSSPIWRTSG